MNLKPNQLGILCVLVSFVTALFVPQMFLVEGVTNGSKDFCECSQDGISNKIDTGMPGCAHHLAGEKEVFSKFCYVKGGTNCVDAHASTLYPGAAWRSCPKDIEVERKIPNTGPVQSHFHDKVENWYLKFGRSTIGLVLCGFVLVLYILMQVTLSWFLDSSVVRNRVSQPNLERLSVAQWTCKDGQIWCRDINDFSPTIVGSAAVCSPFESLVDPFHPTSYLNGTAPDDKPLPYVLEVQCQCPSCTVRSGWTPVRITGTFAHAPKSPLPSTLHAFIEYADENGNFDESQVVVVTQTHVMANGVEVSGLQSSHQQPINSRFEFSVVVPVHMRTSSEPLVRIRTVSQTDFHRVYEIYAPGTYQGISLLE